MILRHRYEIRFYTVIGFADMDLHNYAFHNQQVFVQKLPQQ